MKRTSILIISILFLSACSGTTPSNNTGKDLTAKDCLELGNNEASAWQKDYRLSRLSFQNDGGGPTGNGTTDLCKVYYSGSVGLKSLKVEVGGPITQTDESESNAANLYQKLSNPKIIDSPKIIQIAKKDEPLLREINEWIKKDPKYNEVNLVHLEKIYFDLEKNLYLWDMVIGPADWRRDKDQVTKYSFDAIKGDLLSIVVFKYKEDKGYFDRFVIPVEPG